MAIYWIDPYLKTSSNGNGTTDTTTENGSYAAPFSWSNSQLFAGNTNSPTAITTLNSTTLANGDEIRIKGLPFATLFQNLGQVYFQINDQRPVTGNSTFSSNIDTNVRVFAYDTTFTNLFLPDAVNNNINWMFGAFDTAVNSTDIRSDYFDTNEQFLYRCGFTSSSGGTANGYTYPDLYQLKSAYYTDGGEVTIADGHYGNTHFAFFDSNLEIKISSGWTSETQRGGISLMHYSSGSTYRTLYCFNAFGANQLYGKASKLHIDCPELIWVISDFTYHDDLISAYNGSSTALTASIGGAIGRVYHYRPFFGHSSDGTNKTYELRQHNGRQGTSYFGNYGNSQNTTVKYYFIIIQDIYNFYNYFVNGIDLHLGTFIHKNANYYSSYDGFWKLTVSSSGTYPEFNSMTFLPGSCYGFASHNTYYSGKSTTMLPSNSTTGNFTNITLNFPTGTDTIYRPSVAGSPMVGIPYYYPPLKGSGLGEEATYVSVASIPINGNRWFDVTLDITPTFPLVNAPMGILECGGSDYRSAICDINVLGRGLTTNGSTLYPFDANDYDGKPIVAIPHGNAGNSGSPALMYNDTVSSVDCLVIQHSRVSGSHEYRVPFVLKLPDSWNNDSSDDVIRVQIDIAKSSSFSNINQQFYAISRNGSSTSPHVIGTNFTVTSTDVSSPDQRQFNLTLNGRNTNPKPTSLFCWIIFRFPNNTDNMKFYITDIASSAV
jgi:hypothetical protein